MKIHPISPALYLAGMVTLFVTLMGYIIEFPWFDPVLAIIVFLFCQEASKFVAEFTMEEEDGKNNQ